MHRIKLHGKATIARVRVDNEKAMRPLLVFIEGIAEYKIGMSATERLKLARELVGSLNASDVENPSGDFCEEASKLANVLEQLADAINPRPQAPEDNGVPDDEEPKASASELVDGSSTSSEAENRHYHSDFGSRP